MLEQWDKLKGALISAQDYLQTLNVLENYSEDEQIISMKNTLSDTMEIATYCVFHAGDLSKDNNENMQKLNQFKNVNRIFEEQASTTKILSIAIDSCAKTQFLLNQFKSGELNGTRAAIQLKQILFDFSVEFDKYNEMLYAHDMVGQRSIFEIVNLTSSVISDAFAEFQKAPNFDAQEVNDTEVQGKEQPTDKNIQNRLDENDRQIQVIDKTVDEHSGNLYNGSNIEGSLDEALKYFAILGEQLQEMTGGNQIHFDTEMIGNTIRSLRKSIEEVYGIQLSLNEKGIDYSFISQNYESVMRECVEGSINDLKDYQYSQSVKMFDQIQSLAHTAAPGSVGETIIEKASAVMVGMLNVDYSQNHGQRQELAGNIQTFISEFDKRLQKEDVVQQQSDITSEPHMEEISSEQTSEVLEDISSAINGENVNDNYSSNGEYGEELSDNENSFVAVDISEETFSGALTSEDVELLKGQITELRKYGWIKHALLNDPEIKISKSFRMALEQDTFKDIIDNECKKQPKFNEILPFTDKETSEMKEIISKLCKEGVERKDIVRRAAFEIKHNASQGLQETFTTLRGKFMDSHKYFYLTGEFIGNLSTEIMKSMENEQNSGREM